MYAPRIENKLTFSNIKLADTFTNADMNNFDFKLTAFDDGFGEDSSDKLFGDRNGSGAKDNIRVFSPIVNKQIVNIKIEPTKKKTKTVRNKTNTFVLRPN